MSDFSVYTAEQVVDWMSQGTVATPPSTIYVALFDADGTEVSTDFQNDRVAVDADTGWNVTNTSFENADVVDFGEAAEDISDIEDVALYDAETGGNELAQYAMDSTPFNIAAGSSLQFPAGDLQFDVIDRTEV